MENKNYTYFDYLLEEWGKTKEFYDSANKPAPDYDFHADEEQALKTKSGKQAQKLGLTYAGWGRWKNADGKVTHKSLNSVPSPFSQNHLTELDKPIEYEKHVAAHGGDWDKISSERAEKALEKAKKMGLNLHNDSHPDLSTLTQSTHANYLENEDGFITHKVNKHGDLEELDSPMVYRDLRDSKKYYGSEDAPDHVFHKLSPEDWKMAKENNLAYVHGTDHFRQKSNLSKNAPFSKNVLSHKLTAEGIKELDKWRAPVKKPKDTPAKHHYDLQPDDQLPENFKSEMDDDEDPSERVHHFVKPHKASVALAHSFHDQNMKNNNGVHKDVAKHLEGAGLKAFGHGLWGNSKGLVTHRTDDDGDTHELDKPMLMHLGIDDAGDIHPHRYISVDDHDIIKHDLDLDDDDAVKADSEEEQVPDAEVVSEPESEEIPDEPKPDDDAIVATQSGKDPETGHELWKDDGGNITHVSKDGKMEPTVEPTKLTREQEWSAKSDHEKIHHNLKSVVDKFRKFRDKASSNQEFISKLSDDEKKFLGSLDSHPIDSGNEEDVKRWIANDGDDFIKNTRSISDKYIQTNPKKQHGEFHNLFNTFSRFNSSPTDDASAFIDMPNRTKKYYTAGEDYYRQKKIGKFLDDHEKTIADIENKKSEPLKVYDQESGKIVDRTKRDVAPVPEQPDTDIETADVIEPDAEMEQDSQAMPVAPQTQQDAPEEDPQLSLDFDAKPDAQEAPVAEPTQLNLPFKRRSKGDDNNPPPPDDDAGVGVPASAEQPIEQDVEQSDTGFPDQGDMSVAAPPNIAQGFNRNDDNHVKQALLDKHHLDVVSKVDPRVVDKAAQMGLKPISLSDKGRYTYFMNHAGLITHVIDNKARGKYIRIKKIKDDDTPYHAQLVRDESGQDRIDFKPLTWQDAADQDLNVAHNYTARMDKNDPAGAWTHEFMGKSMKPEDFDHGPIGQPRDVAGALKAIASQTGTAAPQPTDTSTTPMPQAAEPMATDMSPQVDAQVPPDAQMQAAAPDVAQPPVDQAQAMVAPDAAQPPVDQMQATATPVAKKSKKKKTASVPPIDAMPPMDSATAQPQGAVTGTPTPASPDPLTTDVGMQQQVPDQNVQAPTDIAASQTPTAQPQQQEEPVQETPGYKVLSDPNTGERKVVKLYAKHAPEDGGDFYMDDSGGIWQTDDSAGVLKAYPGASTEKEFRKTFGDYKNKINAALDEIEDYGDVVPPSIEQPQVQAVQPDAQIAPDQDMEQPQAAPQGTVLNQQAIDSFNSDYQEYVDELDSKRERGLDMEDEDYENDLAAYKEELADQYGLELDDDGNPIPDYDQQAQVAPEAQVAPQMMAPQAQAPVAPQAAPMAPAQAPVAPQAPAMQQPQVPPMQAAAPAPVDPATAAASVHPPYGSPEGVQQSAATMQKIRTNIQQALQSGKKVGMPKATKKSAVNMHNLINAALSEFEAQGRAPSPDEFREIVDLIGQELKLIFPDFPVATVDEPTTQEEPPAVAAAPVQAAAPTQAMAQPQQAAGNKPVREDKKKISDLIAEWDIK